MELGNMMFGNSRGRFPIEREGWEDELYRLFEAYAPSGDTRGEELENDTFAVMPYWWGGCTCGAECPQHADDCDIVTGWDDWVSARMSWCSGESDEEGMAMVDLSKLSEYPIPPPKCTCGAEEHWQEKDEHEPTCKLLAPNFLHKKSGFEIQWYKYPLRDSYMNQDITQEQFGEIITDCIKSLE